MSEIIKINKAIGGANALQIKTAGSVVTIAASDWGVFPALYGKFLDFNPTTETLEMMGGELCQDSGDEKVIEFLDGVMTKWGGRYGPAKFHGVKAGNDVAKIRSVILDAAKILDGEGGTKQAIEKVTDLYGLGISFGSKALRMLKPEKAGVYDSILQKHLPYPDDAAGYVEFCDFCGKVAKEIAAGTGENWWVAKAEAAIFTALSDKSIKKERILSATCSWDSEKR